MPSTLIRRTLRAGVLAYQYSVGLVLPPRCRFYPTCSNYALDALRLHGPGRALILIVARLGRCHPFCDGGYDPVPNPPER